MRASQSAIQIPITILAVLVTACSLSNILLDEESADFEEKHQEIPPLNNGYSAIEDFDYIINKNGEVKITGYTGTAESLIIPHTIENLPVTQIGDGVFSDEENMELLIIPENISDIGKSSFKNCKKLRMAILGSNIKQIGSRAFAGCSSLEIIQFKGDAPSIENRWILGTSTDLTVYYVHDKNGFTNSNWINLHKEPLNTFTAPEIYATPGESHVELSWSMSENIRKETVLGFEVYYRESGNSAWTNLYTEVCSAKIDNLLNGTCYEFSLSMINIAGNGDVSEIVTATPFTIPEAPAVTVDRESDIVLRWDAPNDMGSEITGYNVYRDGNLICLQDPGNTEYSVGNLESGVKYNFQVSASNIAGEGSKSETIEVTFENKFTIFFDAGDDVFIESITLKPGAAIVAPDTPAREGYFFKEWIPLIPSIMPEHNITVKAVWDEIVNVPHHFSELCYTGELQTCIVAGSGYDLFGDYSMKDAGEYVAYLSLSEGYVWPDGTYDDRKATWKINPVIVYVNPENNQFKGYSDEDSEIEYTLSEVVDVMGNLDRVPGEVPGIYAIGIGSLRTDNGNYRLEMGDDAYYFEIIAVCPGAPTDLEIVIDEEYCVKLQWCAPSFDGGCEICSYEIWASIDGGIWTLYKTAEDSMVSIISADFDKEYEFAVKSLNFVGESEFSEPVFVRAGHAGGHAKSDDSPEPEYHDGSETVFRLSLFSVILLSLTLMVSRRI